MSFLLARPDFGLFLKDDFYTNDAVSDANVGELGWEIVAVGNTGTFAYQTQTTHGVLRHTTASTADGDGDALRLFTDGLVISPGTQFGARVRYPDVNSNALAGNNFRVGLDDSVTATSPTVGVWLDSDAGVLSCQVDSADHGDEAVSVTGHPDLTSGTTAVLDEWLEFQAICSGRANDQGGPDEVDFYIRANDLQWHHVAKVPSNIDNDEEVEAKIIHWQDTGSADDLEFEVDYFWFWIPRT